MTIRPLDPRTDLASVLALYTAAQDFWLLTDRKLPDLQKAADFFTDTPPNCDPSQSCRLGLFAGGRLIGVAELSFGFPEPQDAYLGLMVFAPDARGIGLGQTLLAHVETLARARGCPSLFLAVLEENPKARAFWERHGFRPTGVTRDDPDTGHRIHRLVKPL